MTSGGPLNHTEIVSNYIYNSAFTSLNFGGAAAASVMVMIILMVFAMFYVGPSAATRPATESGLTWTACRAGCARSRRISR